mmetsp:Transcript_27495/g.41613  ORF Transcript_27495/g.41613 Transcript_27495/m.41613 type:complete len:576 (-) Transcript_27495:44-1771(-)
MIPATSPLVTPARPSKAEVIRLLERYPLPVDSTTGKVMTFTYGTAGFRYKANLLEGIMVRVGILAAYRSQPSSSVGVMVTASHNDESYNGVKIADPTGGMMGEEGEALAVQLANAATAEQVLKVLSSDPKSSEDIVVHFGRDTRHHSASLCDLAVRAAQAMGASIHMHGVVTTPQLHYCVMMDNPQHLPKLLLPPQPHVKGHYTQLSEAYLALLGTTATMNPSTTITKPLLVDCACGVGYEHVKRLNDIIQQMGNGGRGRSLVACNAPTEGPLNENCGSEFVQKQQKPPTWYGDVDNEKTAYAASIDGDADRIVFFSQEDDFILLDGDKIAVLICLFLKEQLSTLQKQATSSELKLGVVQTAYANGASTRYLQQLPIAVEIAKTGVKHVHKAAHDSFDIGVYFEANGHGTVLFGEKFYEFIDYCEEHLKDDASSKALTRLALLPKLINQAVGDALSDLLLVDAILTLQNHTLASWSSLYTDLPSKQSKVTVPDRTMIVMNYNETACVAPAALQQDLNICMKQGGRCFVRPSGTENVVRIYAEAETSGQAQELASRAGDLVIRHCADQTFPPSSKI